MKQSTVIFGVLLFTFIVYITMRGQLDGYLGLLSSKKKTETSTASKLFKDYNFSSGMFGSGVSDALQKFKKKYNISDGMFGGPK